VLAAIAACTDRPPATPGPDADSNSTVAPSPAQARGPLVVFLGDSLTAGNGLAQSEAYPAVIQARLASEGHPLRIVNAGVSGDTSAGGLARLPWLLAQHPDVVVVALGANDGLRGLPAKELEQNLTQIVARSREAGAKVLLVGMHIPPNYGEEYARAFGEVYPRVALANTLAFVPFLLDGVGGNPALNQADGIHPTAAGQEKLADTVWKGLSELVVLN
jgi:acyl-CoA thioesterase-1